MESIRQGADNNSKSFQANGLLQSHQEYNTAQKIIAKIIWGCGNQVVLTRLARGGAGAARGGEPPAYFEALGKAKAT
jgi:hypothetical protein